MKTKLDTYNNSHYKPGNPIKRILWYFANIIFLKNYLNPFSSIKIVILKIFGSKIGRNVIIKPGVNIKYPWKLIIGNNVWIGEKVWLDNLGLITINDNVCISQEAMLICGNHNYKKSSFDLIVKNIIVKEGVWIGAKAIVCAGVICNSHSVLTIGSVATKNMNEYTIYSGNPASEVKKRIIES